VSLATDTNAFINGGPEGNTSGLVALATNPVNDKFSAYLKKSTKHITTNVNHPNISKRDTVIGFISEDIGTRNKNNIT
jgi:hypothetical protein